MDADPNKSKSLEYTLGILILLGSVAAIFIWQEVRIRLQESKAKGLSEPTILSHPTKRDARHQILSLPEHRHPPIHALPRRIRQLA